MTLKDKKVVLEWYLFYKSSMINLEGQSFSVLAGFCALSILFPVLYMVSQLLAIAICSIGVAFLLITGWLLIRKKILLAKYKKEFIDPFSDELGLF